VYHVFLFLDIIFCFVALLFSCPLFHGRGICGQALCWFYKQAGFKTGNWGGMNQSCGAFKLFQPYIDKINFICPATVFFYTPLWASDSCRCISITLKSSVCKWMTSV
jgi:hypothetical protein